MKLEFAQLYTALILPHQGDTRRPDTSLHADTKGVPDNHRKELLMKTSLKLTLIGTLLAAAAGLAYSQGPMGGQRGGMGCDGGMQGMQGMQSMQGMKHDRMGKMDPAKMQARLDARNAALKTQLKITSSQEAAWNAYTDAMKPGAGMMNHQRPDPAEMAKLTTPERLDKMQQLRAQHMSDMTVAMDKHATATKALYASLTPEQQKLFDAAAMPGQRGMAQQRGPGQRAGKPAVQKG